jgi:hypothetical protein
LNSPDNAVEIELNAQIITTSIDKNWIAEITFLAVPRQIDENLLKYKF